jgi:signal peptidase I
MATRSREGGDVSDTEERTTPPAEIGHDRSDGRRNDTEWVMPLHESAPPLTPPPAPPFSWPTSSASHESAVDDFHHPLDRVTGRLPRRLRIAVDWIVTILGAIAIVLAIKAWVVNPYRIPSSSMEPTLHCARPAPGCEARFSDRVLANRFIYHFHDPHRGDVIVFKTPAAAKAKCGAGGTFVKRIIGLPGERVQIRLRRGAAYVFIDGRRLEEPYIENDRRDIGPEETYRVPLGHYFVMGDNRSQSCDSRVWGSVPRENIIGKVFMTYWPPQRISFR